MCGVLPILQIILVLDGLLHLKTIVLVLHLLKSKSEVSFVFPIFHSLIQNRFGTKIRTLWTDNGRECFNQSLIEYMENKRIIHHSSCVDTPQKNGVAESKSRHLLEVAHALLFEMDVQKTFWGGGGGGLLF